MQTPPRRVVAVSLAVAATLPGDALLYAVLPVVYADLGLELWMVGVLLSANRIVRLATNPLAGVVATRFGIHRPFVASVFATSLVTAAYAAAPGFAAWVALRFVWGALWSFLRLGGFLAALAAGSVGRGYALGFYNGVANLGTLLAMATGGLLTDTIGLDATLLVCGTGEPAPYRALAARLGVSERVRFLGHRTDVEQLHAGSDLFVLPTRYDPFSNACLEAMSSGLPVATTPVNGASELIESGQSGIVLEDRFDEAFALLGDPGQLASMGKSARERVKRLTWERHAEDVLAMYGRLGS